MTNFAALDISEHLKKQTGEMTLLAEQDIGQVKQIVEVINVGKFIGIYALVINYPSSNR